MTCRDALHASQNYTPMEPTLDALPATETAAFARRIEALLGGLLQSTRSTHTY